MSTNPVIQELQPTWDGPSEISKGWLTGELVCTHIAAWKPWPQRYRHPRMRNPAQLRSETFHSACFACRLFPSISDISE